ncbi:hypothetical protein SPACI_055780 [Sporomusa acidovorans DSM 3132]|uniref:Uncharacterized protein n=1 Tax=Sporomusa acidovorans (strain ATCC 49682 / DSM 3132 / Mol) TaxID=1123286 RepID=A0ABZ3JAJ8_SPOA4|nr:chloramphenicol acetyltransferase [Sporomusa acidovorans DSM 3132]SDE00857.1 Chloramphenicol acetyltransferase [Sporomusa acidovorans]
MTRFKKLVKERNWFFTMAFIYAVTKCANEIEEFRYRFLDGAVVLYESIDTSFTYMEKETDDLSNLLGKTDVGKQLHIHFRQPIFTQNKNIGHFYIIPKQW